MLFPPVCSSNNDQVAIFLLGGETCRILSDALYTCILVATGEELLKLAGFAKIRSKKFYGAKVLAVIVPVGLWATYHGIQAYNNPVMIVSAFFNGLILMSLLWMTKSFLAPIIAHGLYNTVTILLNCVQGTSGVGTPMFPSGWGTGDIFPIVLAIVWVFFILVPIIKRYPSEKS
jgi:membrane protease YdiL (CAAX protease family)